MQCLHGSNGTTNRNTKLMWFIQYTNNKNLHEKSTDSVAISLPILFQLAYFTQSSYIAHYLSHSIYTYGLLDGRHKHLKER